MPRSLAPFGARLLEARGDVEGVGFRPWVWRLAHALGLQGWVKNGASGALVFSQGDVFALEALAQGILALPAPGRVEHLSCVQVLPQENLQGFRVEESAPCQGARVPLDRGPCPECERELFDHRDRRYAYPFIACAACGPRFSLTEGLAWDREKTAMNNYPLCPECEKEYLNPQDRRFHAEILSCASCGPSLFFEEKAVRLFQGEALEAAMRLLQEGRILALKSVGGYQFLADARNPKAVERLRARKNRPQKPFALLFADIEQARGWLWMQEKEEFFLAQPSRPILILPQKRPLLGVAPHLGTFGAMLPPSPLHLLLARAFSGPLVCTSANKSGFPLVAQDEEAKKTLSGIADGFLWHDRRIIHPVEDPVFGAKENLFVPMRLGRGVAPVEFPLPRPLPRPLLALGAEKKAAVALGWGSRAVLAPYAADASSPEGVERLLSSGRGMERLYGVRGEALTLDAHPDYAVAQEARHLALPMIKILHHLAHASCAWMDAGFAGPALVFAFDGTGMGEGGALWGGEVFFGVPGRWQRLATLRPFRLLGGEAAAKEPWRVAASLLWEEGLNPAPQDLGAPVDEASWRLLHQAWKKGVNAPMSSAMGRLFEGAAAILGVVFENTFEGEAAVRLESLAVAPLLLQRHCLHQEKGMMVMDWGPWVRSLWQKRNEPQAAAHLFHEAVLGALLAVAREARKTWGARRIAFSGGVFQNLLLLSSSLSALSEERFDVRTPSRAPPNDGGIALGQLLEAAGV